MDTDVWVESTGPEELIIRVCRYGAGLEYPFHLDEVNETINELYGSEEDEPEG